MAENGNILQGTPCPKNCGGNIGDEKHPFGIIPPGDYEGDGGKLGDHTIKKCYSESFSKHPFFVPNAKIKKKNTRNGIEAHHLLSSYSIRRNEKYKKLAYLLGYNINHRNNCVLLPTVMQIACAFAAPLHNGGHAATFILEKYTVKDIKDTKNWVLEQVDPSQVNAIFPQYDTLNEIAALNYEDHVNDLVANICKVVLKEDICDLKERINTASQFIKNMDKHSQIVFKKLVTFKWTLTSDGLDYAPGSIGCCKCKSLKKKREKIKNALTDVKLPSASNAKGFWVAVLSDKNICDKIDKLNFRCTAGTRPADHHINNQNAPYQERMGIEEFGGFKEKTSS